MEKTAIQQAIEILTTMADGLPLSAGYYREGMRVAIRELESLLPAERKQIEEAYIDGWQEHIDNPTENTEYIASNYFTQTYNDGK